MADEFPSARMTGVGLFTNSIEFRTAELYIQS